MSFKKHLNYDELLVLFKYISLGYSQKKIVQLTNKNRSTIYRLIINNSKIEQGAAQKVLLSKKYQNCSHLLKCKKDGLNCCPNNCPSFEKWVCPKLKSFPYICNFCDQRYVCKKDKRIFNPEEAYILRKERISDAKKYPQITNDKLSEFNDWISPMIKNGLSVESIYSSLKEMFPASSRTIRNWINRGYLDAKRIDLRNAVKRIYSPTYEYKRVSKNPLLKVGRTYSSFLEYMKTHNNEEVTQFDTVHGKKSDKKSILTIHHPVTKFQFGLLLENFTATEVLLKISKVREKIGDDYYFKFFRIMLCDNGPEFDKMNELEIDKETGEVFGKVFYTRPYQSGDKGSCERNHELFRYVIAKGKSLDDLTQDDLNFIFSNINSYPRKSLNYQCPVDMINKLMGKEFASKLGILKVPFKNLTFKKKIK